jgi:hypothetical protein
MKLILGETPTAGDLSTRPGRSPHCVKAKNRHVERVFNPDRKDHHWGKRALAMDR